MKAQSIILSVFILFAAFTVNAQNGLKKDTIKVWGNCGMCKKIIEKSAITAGAKTADWNTDTKVLAVTYSAKASNNKKIQQSIAASGYDTQDFTANNQAYDKLHACCKYDRKETASVKEEKSCCEGSEKACCKDGEKKDCCSKEGQKTEGHQHQ
ncbi:MAG: heavy-metal-associated domain-containing protein [Pseudobacter sp.]|uniref:heavy-metal-associated domain-containing protein n=1 Tax=Pseudobacter sp. TaxID=2045420 RepID=UPI003F7E36E4